MPSRLHKVAGILDHIVSDNDAAILADLDFSVRSFGKATGPLPPNPRLWSLESLTTPSVDAAVILTKAEKVSEGIGGNAQVGLRGLIKVAISSTV